MLITEFTVNDDIKKPISISGLLLNTTSKFNENCSISYK